MHLFKIKTPNSVYWKGDFLAEESFFIVHCQAFRFDMLLAVESSDTEP